MKLFIRNILVLCFILINLTTFAQPNRDRLQGRIENQLNKARRTYARGRVETAINEYWLLLEVAPNLLVAHLELGEIYFNLKIYNRAIELLEPALSRGESQLDKEVVANYYCVLTRSYVGINNMGGANRALIKAAQLAPRNPKPRTVLGDIYVANKRYATAAKAYRQALQLDPTYAPAREKLRELQQNYGYELVDARPTISQKKEKEKVVKIAQAAKEAEVKEVLEEKPIKVVKVVEPLEPEVEEVEEAVDEEELAVVREFSAEVEEEALDAGVEVNVSGRPHIVAEPEEEYYEEHEGHEEEYEEYVEVQEEYLDPDDWQHQEVSEDNIDMLLGGTGDQKERAIAYFITLGEEGLYKIEDLLYDGDPRVRLVAVRALMSFTAFRKEVKEMLLDAGDDPDDMVMLEISQSLEELQQKK